MHHPGPQWKSPRVGLATILEGAFYSLNKGHLQRPSPELESGKTKTMGALQTDLKNPLNRYQIKFFV